MQFDHLSYAAGPDGLEGTSARLSELLGEKFVDGGVHPRFGTNNMILPLTGGCYLEVVDVLDHPASDKAPFGQAVRSRSREGGGWLAWGVRVDDIGAVASRLGRTAVPGSRHRPDGVELRWLQVGLEGLLSDPELPFFVQWEGPPSLHPSAGATGHVSLRGVEVTGSPERLASWLGTPTPYSTGDHEISWVSGARTGVVAATFITPDGPVRI